MKKMILVVAWLVVVVCFTSCLENETIPGDSQHVAPPATPSSRDSGNSEHPEWRRDYERHIDQWVDESANEADRFKEEERISRARSKLLEQEAAKNRNRFGGLGAGQMLRRVALSYLSYLSGAMTLRRTFGGLLSHCWRWRKIKGYIVSKYFPELVRPWIVGLNNVDLTLRSEREKKMKMKE
ncbi:MAG TPA: hypothetical protein PLK71_02655 [Candidatus Paceibacterota bacterium]|nr:hypothetical protein [Candidatus Paceibacterota bacterium]